jgi:hypothetical protein
MDTLEEVERLAADLEREFSQDRPSDFDVSGPSSTSPSASQSWSQNRKSNLPLQAQAPRGKRYYPPFILPFGKKKNSNYVFLKNMLIISISLFVD